jgi:DNA primase large subunit
MSGFLSLLNQEFLTWISKNKVTFMLVILIAGNIYQYMDRTSVITRCEAEKKALNEQIQKLSNESIDYERRRSEKLEFLIQALPKVKAN